MSPSASRDSVVSTAGTDNDRKLKLQIQEFIQTEKQYIHDLKMVDMVFRKPLVDDNVIGKNESKIMFSNWTQLIEVATHFYKDLSKRPGAIGSLILDNLPKLHGFVEFCTNQQNALDLIENKEKVSPDFRQSYATCCKHPAARSLPLSYFLLLPLTRVTKYPLMIQNLCKYSTPDNPDHPALLEALDGMKELCSEVNRVVTEVENLQMLYWCQGHVRCETIQPTLIFHSQTNMLGPRKFLHSGILYKAKSHRLLIGLLFNDVLLLTTPDEQIDHPDSFKLTRNSDVILCLYKMPIILRTASIQIPTSHTGSESSEDHRVFAVHDGTEVVNFKAVSSNAKKMWTNQLEKAISSAKTTAKHPASTPAPAKGIGRLLIEVVCVRQLSVPTEFGGSVAPIQCKLSMGSQTQFRQLELSKKDALCTTQLLMESREGNFSFGLYVERRYAPDLCVGTVELPLEDLIHSSGSHRGPILRQLSLKSSELDTNSDQRDAEQSYVILKFVVQLFGGQ